MDKQAVECSYFRYDFPCLDATKWENCMGYARSSERIMVRLDFRPYTQL